MGLETSTNDITQQELVIARICHEINSSYRAAIGEEPSPAFDVAPEWMKDSAVDGVRAILKGTITSPEQSHENWLAHKAADGWKYGPIRDDAKKLHPCIKPFDALPEPQRVKDVLFFNLVHQVSTIWDVLGVEP